MPAVDDLKSFEPARPGGPGRSGSSPSSCLLFHVFVVTRSADRAPARSSATSRQPWMPRDAWHNWGILAMLLHPGRHRRRCGAHLRRSSSMPKLPIGVNLLTLALAGPRLPLPDHRVVPQQQDRSRWATAQDLVHLGIFGYLLLLVSLGAGRRRRSCCSSRLRRERCRTSRRCRPTVRPVRATGRRRSTAATPRRRPRRPTRRPALRPATTRSTTPRLRRPRSDRRTKQGLPGGTALTHRPTPDPATPRGRAFGTVRGRRPRRSW